MSDEPQVVDTQGDPENLPEPIVDWQPARRASGPVSWPAAAVGALAVGALAVGAVAIGTLAIGRLVVGRVRIRQVVIDELIVKRSRGV
jgi:hypothetical protein